MKGLVVILLSFQAISAVMHSWKAFYTGSSGLNNFPEFVALNLLDDEVMGYFDSRIDRFESRQSWMKENLGQEYDDQQTNVLRGHVPTFKGNIEIARERFNQSKGVHIFQNMYGCEWDEETGDVNGYYQYGYDGEAFISFDLKEQTWVAPVQQAVISKNKWNSDRAFITQRKNYLTQICPEWLKKYVNYGRSSLMRTERPSVSLLQKSSSSPVSCHATGFYPNRAEMVWKKDGVELHEGVNKGEILTNNDGTFQMSVDLDVSSVTPEDWERYNCVFQLSGVNEDIVTRLDKSEIRTNEGPSAFPIPAAVGGVVGGLVGIMVILGVAAVVYKRCLKKGNNGFKPANNSDTSSSSSDGSDTKKVPAEEQKMIISTA